MAFDLLINRWTHLLIKINSLMDRIQYTAKMRGRFEDKVSYFVKHLGPPGSNPKVEKTEVRKAFQTYLKALEQVFKLIEDETQDLISVEDRFVTQLRMDEEFQAAVEKLPHDQIQKRKLLEIHDELAKLDDHITHQLKTMRFAIKGWNHGRKSFSAALAGLISSERSLNDCPITHIRMVKANRHCDAIYSCLLRARASGYDLRQFWIDLLTN